MGTGTHMLIPTAHSGSCSPSPPQPDPPLGKAPLGRTHSGPQSPPLRQRLSRPQRSTCPPPPRDSPTSAAVRVVHVPARAACRSPHVGCSGETSRSWPPAPAGALCAPLPSPRGDFFHCLSSRLEPGHPHPSLHLTVPVKDPESHRAPRKGPAPLPRGWLLNTEAFRTEELGFTDTRAPGFGHSRAPTLPRALVPLLRDLRDLRCGWSAAWPSLPHSSHPPLSVPAASQLPVTDHNVKTKHISSIGCAY